MERLKFTEDCRPKEEDIIMCCSNKGYIYCGVVTYPNNVFIDFSPEPDKERRSIWVSMFVNEKETVAKIDTLEIRWWHLLPLTKLELWSGKSY